MAAGGGVGGVMRAKSSKAQGGVVASWASQDTRTGDASVIQRTPRLASARIDAALARREGVWWPGPRPSTSDPPPRTLATYLPISRPVPSGYCGVAKIMLTSELEK